MRIVEKTASAPYHELFQSIRICFALNRTWDMIMPCFQSQQTNISTTYHRFWGFWTMLSGQWSWNSDISKSHTLCWQNHQVRAPCSKLTHNQRDLQLTESSYILELLSFVGPCNVSRRSCQVLNKPLPFCSKTCIKINLISTLHSTMEK